MYTMIDIPQEVPSVETMQVTEVQAEPAVQTTPQYVQMQRTGKKRCSNLAPEQVQAIIRRRRNIDLLESLFWLLAVIYLFTLIFIK